ncbi:hypothetical protein [Coraliomargarita akajimensis]|uniref:Uncharacterized protein n=1 Tax=Coraliomargarita akajimensis (strain DSM 45221 / IAM 15411 / JCM 23193 / KCTC 12865 / 04OKA010-24) TaxID=583355 RepID=D5EMB7_CORAD|nr:hypothetical protein [Coraliomargarita akajimensis]ADE53323.1 hypothetical protein Caka_0297 [Coraliomargarita akajimensis DSM 45221]ADE53614.1 hypothetical protein Caka_0589 [Coraliomargarita akajimensis DSM 45221]
MNPPLSKGIYLEKRRVLLRWGAPLKELFDTGSPECIQERASGLYQLNWQYEEAFDGFPVSVGTKLNEKAKVKEFQISPSAAGNPREVYQATKEKLSTLLEKEGKETVDDYMKLPSTVWKTKELKVTLSVFERFGEYCVLNIKRLGVIEAEPVDGING